jgi:glycosyltransferase involved in cell wall biosynthesis
VRALVAARPPNGASYTQVVIADDGATDPDFVSQLRSHAEAVNFRFLHVMNPGTHGLIHTRRLAIRAATGEVILFLDDDVEIAPDYLERLVARYRDSPAVAGIGGIDMLASRRGVFRRAWARVFLEDSGHVGKLSLSGYSGSGVRWGDASAHFQSEFLSGCNMSFRRALLGGVEAVPWLAGYSLGEDVYISLVAGTKGPLFVDPALRVWHHRSPSSREGAAATARSAIVNHYHLLRVRGMTWLNYAALHWTAVGLMVIALVHPGGPARIRAYIDGIREVHALWHNLGSRRRLSK